jgi:hypothetical protein
MLVNFPNLNLVKLRDLVTCDHLAPSGQLNSENAEHDPPRAISQGLFCRVQDADLLSNRSLVRPFDLLEFPRR